MILDADNSLELCPKSHLLSLNSHKIRIKVIYLVGSLQPANLRYIDMFGIITLNSKEGVLDRVSEFLFN